MQYETSSPKFLKVRFPAFVVKGKGVVGLVGMVVCGWYWSLKIGWDLPNGPKKAVDDAASAA
jgi:hypothetical protein